MNMTKSVSDAKAGGSQSVKMGPWDTSLGKLREWDTPWAEQCFKMATNPWTSGVLSRKLVELISISLSAACTNLDSESTRRHIRAALDEGATREEILLVLKCAMAVAIHSCSLGAPILLEEAKRGCKLPAPKIVATATVDKMKAAGMWNTAWDSFLELDAAWTESFIATGAAIYQTGFMSPKDIELVSIALDASYTHMYEPGTRRHIQIALKLGASVEEIMEVLKLCVVQGVQALNVGIPILDEELKRRPRLKAV
jgi:alkylhydroperoxidase/carboxymuconolactone decarboxylase family protein YurZ